jgi:hypothetical protein
MELLALGNSYYNALKANQKVATKTRYKMNMVNDSNIGIFPHALISNPKKHKELLVIIHLTL